jgi:hypothetical protein
VLHTDFELEDLQLLRLSTRCASTGHARVNFSNFVNTWTSLMSIRFDMKNHVLAVPTNYRYYLAVPGNFRPAPAEVNLHL